MLVRVWQPFGVTVIHINQQICTYIGETAHFEFEDGEFADVIVMDVEVIGRKGILWTVYVKDSGFL